MASHFNAPIIPATLFVVLLDVSVVSWSLLLVNSNSWHTDQDKKVRSLLIFGYILLDMS